MRHFNAVIKVNEDAEFRKTVLDAIKSETQVQMRLFLRESLESAAKKFLEENKEYVLGQVTIILHQELSWKVIGESYDDTIKESREFVKSKFDYVISDERVEKLIMKMLENKLYKAFGER